MANTNTITAIYSLGPQVINSLTTDTLLTETVNGVTSTAVLAMPPNANVDGHAFRVRLIGKATGNANTFTLKFWLGTSLAGTDIATFSASGTTATTGGNFAVEADLTWDSVSGILNGVKSGNANGTLSAVALLTATGLATSAAALQFVASAQFSSASTSNTISVEEFSIEQI